jgi:hypothetical protein
MSEHNNNSNTESVISMRAMEIVTSLAFIALGLVAMTGSIKLGASWSSDGPEAGYFPFYVSLIIIISSAITLYQAVIVNKKKKQNPLLIRNPLAKCWPYCFQHLYLCWVFS